MEFLLFALVGAVVGILAGLFGVGGGLVIVPILAASYMAQGMTESVMQLAIGTSLASIVFTSLSSIRSHHKKQAVLWDWWQALLPGIVLGGVLGATLVAAVSDVFLARFFAFFEIAVGLKIGFSAQNIKQSVKNLSRFMAVAVGFIISFFSTLVGIGGGTLTVPFLLWQKKPMPQAVGTASAIGLPIAFFASCGFVVMGWHVANLPAYSFGYVHLQALLPISLGSVLFAPLGVKLAHSLSPLVLQRSFAVLLVCLGLKMLLQF